VAAQPGEPVVGVGERCHVPFNCGICNTCNRDTPKAEYSVDCLPKLAAALAERSRDSLKASPGNLPVPNWFHFETLGWLSRWRGSIQEVVERIGRWFNHWVPIAAKSRHRIGYRRRIS
jgi:hypothetical protein